MAPGLKRALPLVKRNSPSCDTKASALSADRDGSSCICAACCREPVATAGTGTAAYATTNMTAMTLMSRVLRRLQSAYFAPIADFSRRASLAAPVAAKEGVVSVSFNLRAFAARLRAKAYIRCGSQRRAQKLRKLGHRAE